MKPAEYITLSASTMMLTALGIDIMLPALGELRRHFGLDPNSTATSNIIVFFFMGQVAQLIFGIFSDRFGRLAILRIGFPLYIIGGLVATCANSLGVMCAARFVAGMGASAVFTTTIAGVRDRFAGDQMARTMSLILTIFLFTPIFAPFLGMLILSISSWKVVFLTPPVFGLLIFIWSFRLEESLPPALRARLNWKSLKNSIGQVTGNRTFLRYTAITTLLFSALSSYVSSSERLVGEVYRQPALFPWIFAAIGLGMSVCTLINSRLSMRWGAKRAIRTLLLIYTGIAGILVLIAVLSNYQPGIAVIFGGTGLLLAINLAIEPNSSALALEPLGEMAGLAASIYGTIFFFTGSLLSTLISQLMQHSVMPLVISFFLIGCAGLMLMKRQ
ncbi:MAG: multidrug effflux MFS transporter [Chitinophagaceae bacterium]|nr:multidrug effflux MFS transporter [Chitinophagaceae bacterium]